MCMYMYKELLLHSTYMYPDLNQLQEELPIIGDRGDLRARRIEYL